MCKPMIITGAPSTGKTKNAEVFMRVFGCSRVVDEWDGVRRLSDGDLALTNLDHFQVQPGCRVVSVLQALEQINAVC